ncbi:6-phospho-beta-glucosidase [Arthrobacter sp. A5]|uniref:family 4 glycosyl hydrolase n=1 Tax=Arthrobacter sp. A5 TaxID=576926 RepID=UPI003DA8F28E
MRAPGTDDTASAPRGPDGAAAQHIRATGARLAVIGGGGFRVPLVYRALSGPRYAGLITDLALYDPDPERLQAIRRVLETMPGLKNPPRLQLCTALEQALNGADVVFAAIRPGSTAGRIVDEKVALDLGLLGQETTGAGGISYALRSIPQMLAVAHAMTRICPGAWLVNFTNPAGMVTQALEPVLGPRVLGICDSPIGLVRRAGGAAGFSLSSGPEAGRSPGSGSKGSGSKGSGGTLTGVDYVGLNHMGWLRGLTRDGKDYLPALLAHPGKLAGFEEGRLFGADLLRLLGCIPNEYLFYYYRRRQALAGILAAGQTRGESIDRAQALLYPQLGAAGPEAFALWDAARTAREEGYLAEARNASGASDASGASATGDTSGATTHRDSEDLAGGGYEQVALDAMHALLTGTPAELILNVRNDGAVAALPDDAIIEVPARVDGGGARPLTQSTPDLHQLGLMLTLKAVETAVVQASTEGSRDAALRAFTLHPLVDGAELARALLDGYERAFPALGRMWR